MFEFINNLVIKFAIYLAPVLTALILIIIGTPFYSEKGGISRFREKIINKKNAIKMHIFLIFLELLIPTIIITGFYHLILKFPDWFLSVFFILLGGEVCIWNKNHKWNFTKYYVSLFVLGFLLLAVELVIILLQ